MAPLCGLLLSENLVSVLCILIWLLGFWVWLLWGSSTTSSKGLNSTKMVVTVNFFHYGVSCPSILFAVLVLLVPLLYLSHIIPKGCSHLGSCLGEIAGYAGMVHSAVSPMSTAVAIRFSILGF